MEVLVVAKIQAQHWLRFLTCYFALRLCNLCLVIPGGVLPAALRRRGWELRFLLLLLLLFLYLVKKGMLDKREVNWARVKNEKRKRKRKHRKVLASLSSN